jgi:hypothetical protein
MKTTKLYFALIGTICLFFSIYTVSAQDNIPWLNDYTSDIPVGSTTCSYTYKTIDNNPCKISIEERKTDKKGASTTMAYQFYLSDLNTSAMKFKTSGTTAIVTLEIKQSQKFIRVLKNGDLDGYTSKVEINMSEIDKARSFIDLFKSNVEKCNTSEKKWTSRDEAIQWLTLNISKSETSGTTYEQAFAAGEKSYMASFQSNSIDSKGVKQNLMYDFNLNDINAVKMNMEVAEKTFKIELPVRENNYYIRLKKNDEISYVKAFEIYSDDLEQARNIFNGLIYLVNETPSPKRTNWNSYSAALGFVKENVKEVINGTTAMGQSFSFDNTPSGIVRLETSKKDSKSVVTKNIQAFYLTDLQTTVNVDVSSKSITINLTTKDKNKFVKEGTENSPLAYSGSVEILGSDLENAREIAHAIESAIEKSEKGLMEYSTLEKAIGFMTSNVGELKIDKETIKQTLTVVSDDENKTELKVLTTDEKAVSVEETFDIYPEDLKIENLKIKVSGKKLAVVVSTGKLKYIKCYKDKVQQNYSSDVEVLFDDVLKAKNFINAITMLHKKSLVADRTFNDKVSSMVYIMEHITKLDVAGVAVDQKMEQREGDNCKGKFTRVETNSKGVSTENVFELTMYDVDPKKCEIEVSSKSLNVNIVTKGKYIKPYKNGEAGNFVDAISVDVDNILVAKKMLAAFSSLSSYCK